MNIQSIRKYIKNIFINEYLYEEKDIEEEKVINIYGKKNLKFDLVIRKKSLPFIGVKVWDRLDGKLIEKFLKDVTKHKKNILRDDYLQYLAICRERKIDFYKWSAKDKKYNLLFDIFEKDLYAKDVSNIRKFSQLIPLTDAYVFFDKLYYHLYTNSNINRAEVLAEELIKIILCKLLDEEKNKNNLKFRLSKSSLSGLFTLYRDLRRKYPDIFVDDFKLDEKSLKFVVKALQNYSLLKSNRDAVAEAFQAIIGPALRGDKGQFFTPKPVVDLVINSLEDFIDENTFFIDPACGVASFIKSFILKLKEKKISIKGEKIYGLDIDTLSVKISRMLLTIFGVDPINIYQVDSLDKPQAWQFGDIRGKFDLLLTNPPFGSKIPIKDKTKLAQYILARKWNKKKCEFENEVAEKQVPQILFIERSLEFLKKEGIGVLVLPETLFASPQYKYVPKYLLENYQVLAVISLPEETFLPSTHTKTVLVFIRKRKVDENYSIFFGIVNYVGHNRQGKSIEKNDVPLISQKLREFLRTGKLIDTDLNYFVWNFKDLEDYILIPEFYRNKKKRDIYIYSKSSDYIFLSFEEIFERGYVERRKGNEVGSENYGCGNVPFIRTSDLTDWFITSFPTKFISEDIYAKYKDKQDVKEGDILFVTDGTYLIGRTAYITKFDEKIVYQSHFYKFRVIDNNLFNKYVFFYILNSKFVQDQIKDYTITQATISSIIPNLNKIILPIPRSPIVKEDITRKVKNLIHIYEKQKEVFNSLMFDIRMI